MPLTNHSQTLRGPTEMCHLKLKITRESGFHWSAKIMLLYFTNIIPPLSNCNSHACKFLTKLVPVDPVRIKDHSSNKKNASCSVSDILQTPYSNVILLMKFLHTFHFILFKRNSDNSTFFLLFLSKWKQSEHVHVHSNCF